MHVLDNGPHVLGNVLHVLGNRPHVLGWVRQLAAHVKNWSYVLGNGPHVGIKSFEISVCHFHEYFILDYVAFGIRFGIM